MSWLRKAWTQPWWVAICAVGGLLASIAIAGLAGVWLNERVDRRTDDARYDVELEEVEVRVPELPQPDEFRLLADDYREEFRSAVEVYDSDPEEFGQTSGRSLDTLYRMEEEALEIDALAVDALDSVDRATVTSRFVLAAVLGGPCLAGAALAYAVLRVVGELRRLHNRQRTLSEELARASQAKSDFLADVSHEIRTLLTVMRGNAETGLAIQRDCAHDEILEEIIKEAEKTSRMARERGTALETEHEGHGYARMDPARVGQSALIP